jgi:son of sevenless
MMEKFHRIEEIFSRKQEYKNYRYHVEDKKPPMVPYLGVCMTDLILIDNGNFSMNKKKFVVWSYYVARYQTVKSFLSYQSFGFPYKKIPQIEEFIVNEIFSEANVELDHSFLELSRKLEPRKF